MKGKAKFLSHPVLNINEEKAAFLLTGLSIVVFCLISFLKNGTGDSGDSISHFLIAKYSFKHPALFLNHWGKPLFTLLSSPFAQFGFTGIKVFNSLIASLTGYVTYKTARKLGMKNSLLVFVLLFFAPQYFVLIFSGLTEYLFAFALILSVYLIIDKKVMASVILVSFLPFIRSEGLIIIGVFLIYMVIKGYFKILPLILTGHVIYGVAGLHHYGHFLWVFNAIPYMGTPDNYGSGHIFDFFSKLYYVIGFPLYVLLVIGLITIIFTLFKRNRILNRKDFSAELILIVGSFLAFFMAHSIFWAFGLFHSFGLKRVLICTIPLISLMALRGLNIIALVRIKKVNLILPIFFTAYVMIFPFTGNPAAIKWNRELDLSPDQKLIDQLSSYIRQTFPGYTLYYTHPYISLKLGIDPYDKKEDGLIRNVLETKKAPAHSLIIWDSWFSVIEEKITLDYLLQNPNVSVLKTYDDAGPPAVRLVVLQIHPQTKDEKEIL